MPVDRHARPMDRNWDQGIKVDVGEFEGRLCEKVVLYLGMNVLMCFILSHIGKHVK